MSVVAFPFSSTGAFRYQDSDGGKARYRCESSSRLAITAPTNGYVTMFRQGDHWRLLFFVQGHEAIPSVENWVAPATTGFHLSMDQLDADTDAAETVAFYVLKHYAEHVGRTVVTVEVQTDGSYRAGTEFEIARSDSLDDATIRTSAHEFVTRFWNGTSAVAVQVSQGATLFAVEASGLTTTATMGTFHARVDMDAQMDEAFFWLDSHEYYARLRDQNLLQPDSSSPYRDARAAEVAETALRAPFAVFCTRDFAGGSGARMNVLGGLQNLVISLPIEIEPPLRSLELTIPPEVFYGFPRYADDTGENLTSDPVVSAVLTGDGRAIWRLQVGASDIRELSSSGTPTPDVDIRWQDTGFDDDATSWEPRQLLLLLNFGSTTSSPPSSDADLTIRFHVHGDLTERIRRVVNRIVTAKARMMQALQRPITFGADAPTAQEAMSLLLLLAQVANCDAVPEEVRAEIQAQALSGERARQLVALFAEQQRILERNIGELGDSLRLNVFERPYFAQQLRARIDTDGFDVLVQVYAALEGTTVGGTLIADYAGAFIRNGLDEAIDTPSHIDWALCARYWKVGRYIHKAVGYVIKQNAQHYMLEVLRGFGPWRTSTVTNVEVISEIERVEGKLIRLLDDLGVTMVRVPDTIESLPNLGGGERSLQRVYTYRLTYRWGYSVSDELASEAASRAVASTPSSLSVLGVGLGFLDLVAKLPSLLPHHRSTIEDVRNMTELSINAAKFMVDTWNSTRSLTALQSLESTYLRLGLTTVVAAGVVHALGAFAALFGMIRSIGDLLEARETPGLADDIVAGMSIAGYGFMFLGEGALMLVDFGVLGAAAGPVGLILLAIGAIVLAVVGIFGHDIEAPPPGPPPLPPPNDLDILVTIALRYNYFGFGSSLARADMDRDDYQIDYQEGLPPPPFIASEGLTSARQISQINSFFFPFRAEGNKVAASGAAGGVDLVIHADMIDVGTRCCITFYAPIGLSPDTLPVTALRRRIGFTIDATSGSGAGYEYRIIEGSPSRMELTIRDFAVTDLADITRAEIVFSIAPVTPDAFRDPSDSFFANYVPHTTRRVVLLTGETP